MTEMSQNPRLSDLAVSESGFVFDPASGATFNVNLAGRAILEELKKAPTLDVITTRLRAEFEVGEADLHNHVLDFVSSLMNYGLLTREQADHAMSDVSGDDE